MTLYLNWKSNKTTSDIRLWFEELSKLNTVGIKIVLFPSIIHLELCKYLISKYKLDYMELGSQDISTFPMGSYTGKVNASQLKDFCNFCIVGHAENRKYDHLTLIDIKNKIYNLLDNSIKPIVCFSNITEIDAEILELSEINKLILAYEPTENIGTDVISDYTELEEIKVALFGQKFTYGGGITEQNVDILKQLEYINGLLIGRASLKVSSIKKIVDIIY